MATAKQTTYDLVTEQIVKALEGGLVPWHKPWAVNNSPYANISGRIYSGINTLLLFVASLAGGFTNHRWATFNQVKELGGTVKKGSKGTLIVFWKFIETEETDENGKARRIPLLRHWHVFNVEQTEGLPEKYYQVDKAEERDHARIEACESLVKGMPQAPEIKHGGNHAAYNTLTDTVKMPKLSTFDTPESYYGTLFHELVHSTGHTSRLDRDMKGAFGSEPYAFEELVAEIGSAFLCADTGIRPVVKDNSASYVKYWIGKLKNDSKLIVKAASKATKAAKWIHGTLEVEQDEEKA